MNESRRMLSFLMVILLGTFATTVSRAANPTTADCLAASEASLKSGNEHSLRAERDELLLCSASSCPGDIRRECLRRVDEVNGSIPTIIFDVKDAEGKDLSAVRLTMDGEVLAERLEGTALSLDPGEHTFSFETPGQPPIEKKLVIREAEKGRREHVIFGTSNALSATTPSAAVGPGATAEPAPLGESNRTHALGTQKTVALVAGGVGVVGVVLGAVFGLQSKSKHDKAQSLGCTGSVCPSDGGVSANSDAVKAGNVSTLAFVLGEPRSQVERCCGSLRGPRSRVQCK